MPRSRLDLFPALSGQGCLANSSRSECNNQRWDSFIGQRAQTSERAWTLATAIASQTEILLGRPARRVAAPRLDGRLSAYTTRNVNQFFPQGG